MNIKRFRPIKCEYCGRFISYEDVENETPHVELQSILGRVLVADQRVLEVFNAD